MRQLRRNKTSYWLSSGETERVPIFEDGRFTGRYEEVRSPPVERFGYITAGTGNVYRNPFGDLPDMERMILMIPFEAIQTGSVVWIDRDPEESPNYEVIASLTSLNQTWLAIKSWTES